MNKIVGYWADWPVLRGNGVVYKRCEGSTFDNTHIPGNMASPAAEGKYFICEVCGQVYEVPSCIFEDKYHAEHAHGRDKFEIESNNGTRTISVSAVVQFGKNMALAMVNTIKDGESPLSVFNERLLK